MYPLLLLRRMCHVGSGDGIVGSLYLSEEDGVRMSCYAHEMSDNHLPIHEDAIKYRLKIGKNDIFIYHPLHENPVACISMQIRDDMITILPAFGISIENDMVASYAIQPAWQRLVATMRTRTDEWSLSIEDCTTKGNLE